MAAVMHGVRAPSGSAGQPRRTEQRQHEKTQQTQPHPSQERRLPRERRSPVECFSEATSRAPREVTGASPTGAGSTITTPLLLQPLLIMPPEQWHEPGLIAILVTTPSMSPPVQKPSLDAFAPQALLTSKRLCAFFSKNADLRGKVFVPSGRPGCFWQQLWTEDQRARGHNSFQVVVHLSNHVS